MESFGLMLWLLSYSGIVGEFEVGHMGLAGG